MQHVRTSSSHRLRAAGMATALIIATMPLAAAAQEEPSGNAVSPGLATVDVAGKQSVILPRTGSGPESQPSPLPWLGLGLSAAGLTLGIGYRRWARRSAETKAGR